MPVQLLNVGLLLLVGPLSRCIRIVRLFLILVLFLLRLVYLRLEHFVCDCVSAITYNY